MGNRPAYFYLLCEHQSTVDDSMAFRLVVYTVRIMEMHLNQHPGSPLPIVYPMVIYTGKRSWNAPKDIFQLFGPEEDLARQILFQPYQRTDVCRMSDDEFSQHHWIGLVEFVLKYSQVRNFAKFMENLTPLLQEIEIYQGADFGKIV